MSNAFRNQLPSSRPKTNQVDGDSITQLLEAKLKDMNHLEDLILENGINGFERAIRILRSFTDGHDSLLTVLKWDGSPSIVFGRDDNGQFIFTDKHGWSAKRSNGKATSPEELENIISNRNMVMDQSRQAHINNMKNVFLQLEKIIPENFRGFFQGDLLYTGKPSVINGNIIFQPNTVKYSIKANTILGKQILASVVGIAVHSFSGSTSVENALHKLIQGNVLFIPPVTTHAIIDPEPIDQLELIMTKHRKYIESLFNPATLKGIANLPMLMYRYINNKVDIGLEDLGDDFEQWLNSQDLSERKMQRIKMLLMKNVVGFDKVWHIIKYMMQIKESLVSTLNNATDLHQTVNGKEGGEGFVVHDHDGMVKLVSRSHFSSVNRVMNR